MNKDVIKKAFDEFEDDKFTDSKEKLKGEIRQGVNDYLKTKLGLEKDPLDGLPVYDEPKKED